MAAAWLARAGGEAVEFVALESRAVARRAFGGHSVEWLEEPVVAGRELEPPMGGQRRDELFPENEGVGDSCYGEVRRE